MVKPNRKCQCRGVKKQRSTSGALLSEVIVKVQDRNQLHELVTAETPQHV